MPGKIISVLPKTTYPVPNTLTANTFIIIPVALGIDATQWRELTILLRVHQFLGGAGARIDLGAHQAAPSTDDPALVFRVGTPLATAGVDWTTYTQIGVLPLPLLFVGTATSGLPGQLDLLLTLRQRTNAQALTIIASADLALKT